MAALRAAFPDKNIDDEVSDYYIADKISPKINTINIVMAEGWQPFIESEVSKFVTILYNTSDSFKREPKS